MLQKNYNNIICFKFNSPIFHRISLATAEYAIVPAPCMPRNYGFNSSNYKDRCIFIMNSEDIETIWQLKKKSETSKIKGSL